MVLLEDLGVLVFDGADAPGFLQGYLTTDAEALGRDPQCTAMCNIKGRVLCTGYAWLEGGRATLVMHRSLCAAVLDFLRPYLAFSKTAASEAHSRVVGFLHGEPPPGSCGSLSGGRLDPERHLFVQHGRAPVNGPDSAAASARGLWDEASIERREVWLQAATSGRFLPQMLGLVERGAVSFSKGCYLGQEVVARAQHRGKVKRALRELNWSGAAPAPGTVVEENRREAGCVVAVSGSGTAGRALAVLVRERSGPFSSPHSETRFQLPAISGR